MHQMLLFTCGPLEQGYSAFIISDEEVQNILVLAVSLQSYSKALQVENDPNTLVCVINPPLLHHRLRDGIFYLVLCQFYAAPQRLIEMICNVFK